MQREKSFTLIELLVVIAIIGLITSVSLVAIDLPGQRQKAKIAKILEFSSSIQNALGSEAVGIWDFDNNVLDTSGYGNNGTINGDTFFTDNTPQKIVGQSTGKYALSLDGAGDYISTKSFGLSSSVNTLTFNAWVKNSLLGQYQTLFSDGSQSGATAFIWGYRTTGSNQLVWQYANGVTFLADLTSDSFFTNYDNQWMMVTIVVDYTNKSAKFYRNGELVNTDTTINTMLYPSVNRVKYIGTYSPAAHYFKGLIDEVRIYDQALTIGQIQKDYAEGLKGYHNLVIR